VIAPAFDTGDLAMRLDRLPQRLRDSLSRALDRLGQQMRLSLTIGTTTDTVTAALRTARVPPAGSRSRASARKKTIHHNGRYGYAKDAMALQPLHRLRALRASFVPSVVSSPLSSMVPEIRAALEEAAREAFAP